MTRDGLKFEELSEPAKQRAREGYLTEAVYPFGLETDFGDFIAIADILGFQTTERQISWSGFSCQGDGASFAGEYYPAKDALDKIKAHAPQDATLHRLAERLTALQVAFALQYGTGLAAKITTSRGSYCHSGCMQAEPRRVEEDDADFPDLIEEEKVLLGVARDLADWLYSSLEDEWDYQCSDECIDPQIQDFDLRYDEDGDTI
jgi:hypothetical protein